jgi:peptidoglycan/xylan/chitin deacetylase (PgdA/CDA1 family)
MTRVVTPGAGRKLAGPKPKHVGPGMLTRSRKITLRLLLNWGVLIAVIIAVLAVRNYAAAEASAPLPPPRASLSPAESQQWRSFPSYTGIVPVLWYHGINATGRNHAVTPQLFADQMLALKVAGFHAITLTQYVDFVHGDRRDLPSKPILLTFDDGRLDAYREATNILRKYGFHATMFTFAGWPVENPGYSLNWGELQSMKRSGIWNVQVQGGQDAEYVRYNAKGAKGSAYAYLRYLPGRGGHLESLRSFSLSVKSDIRWGIQQFKNQVPGFQPLAFAVPDGNYGQEATNDPRIPQVMLPWLRQHFSVVFGGDYLDEAPGHPYQIGGRFSPKLSYRIMMSSKVQVTSIYCRLRDWVTGTPLWVEHRCLRPNFAAEPSTPLAPTSARLSPAQSQQWRGFPSYTGSVPVLSYNGINNTGKDDAVSPRLFARQMLALKVGGFHAITLAQYVDYVHGNSRGLPPKPILLTFDGGRIDSYREATNILSKYGFHATMFTFAGWPVTHPGFSLSWSELQSMQRSGVWDVQVQGGQVSGSIRYDAAGAKGSPYAFLQYLPGRYGHGGRLEPLSLFVQSVTSDIGWGIQQFKSQIPGFQPLGFAVPDGNYGQEATNDPRIPQVMLPWLRQHFSVVFGGDYLYQGRGHGSQIAGRFSPELSYRMTMSPKMQIAALYCRLADWVAGTPLYVEYRCLKY